MDEWDPFADPADAPPVVAPVTVPMAPPVAPPVAPVPRRPVAEPLQIPSVAELHEQLQAVKLQSCPELVQAAFDGDAAKVEARKLDEIGRCRRRP